MRITKHANSGLRKGDLLRYSTGIQASSSQGPGHWDCHKFEPDIHLWNMDCMDYMDRCEDNTFDLAIVDPPYGISASNYKRGGTKYGQMKTFSREYSIKEWDHSPPGQEYFEQLMRTSKNQVIWGTNHFISKMPFDSSCWIVWDKNNGTNQYADCELAWTSFKTSVKIFQWTWHGMLQHDMKNKDKRIHPTQKPVALYRWILMKYAKPGDKILDTHAGSYSSAVAAWKEGFHYTGIEIDQEYFNKGVERLDIETRQLSIF